MGKKFAEYSQFNLSQINKDILAEWEKNDIFRQSIATREGKPSFVFYEGPPSANGMPGIHHVMARTIKDLFNRYKTMKGFQVHRKAGWDTHGLPVELGVEKSLGITKEDIGKKISVQEYNTACRKEVMKFTQEWENLTRQMGYWVDMNDPYITYDNRYIETLWWLLKELYKKGYLYKGYTIQPYSPAAGTGLSSHELNQPGCYRDVKDTTVVSQFKIVDPKPEMAQWGTPVFLAWTTTPWTLPSNTALCVGPKIDYVAVQSYNAYNGEKITAVLAKALLYTHFNKKAEELPLEAYAPGDKLVPFKVVGEYKGTDLLDMKYEQLFPWVKPVEIDNDGNWTEASDKAFRVILGDYVTTEDGTGIVHIAPTFGADDAFVARAAGIPSLFMINRKGEPRPMVDLRGKYYELDELDERFVEQCVNSSLYTQYGGAWVKNAYDPQFTVDGKYDEVAAQKAESLDIVLCMEMKQSNRAFKIEKHVHNYPHCWRTDKPVLYYPLDSWFIRSTAAKDEMIALNRTINWKPESTGTGRFGKWLENLNDWNLSRSRYWGTPLPIWRSEDGGEELCIGSVEELYGEIEKAVAAGFMTENPYKTFKPGDYSAENYAKIDLHRPYVDDIVLVSPTGQPMKRESDLIDVWFDSGAMPFAQLHYPFENKEMIDDNIAYPADFISEGVDQTRGWFFTLHAISTMVKGSCAYKNVISNGLVLDKNGNKMSKRLGNAVDPFATIDQYGSDPLRWYMMTNASPWDNLKFDIGGVEETRRKFFGTLYNTYSFFALYANVDGFVFGEPEVEWNQRPEIDRWILSRLNSLVKAVDASLNDFEPTKAGRLIAEFVDQLSNWYVRLSRKRFWGGEMNEDKLSAYQTLYLCLETLSKLIAPFSPFYADRLYTDLIAVTGRETWTSVHLSDFPQVREEWICSKLEDRMQIAQDMSSMILALRRKVNIKVRIPLSTLMVPVLNEEQKEEIESVKELILNEVNVKELRYADNSTGILVKRIKPDFKKLGPKYGKIMKQLAAAIAAMSQEEIISFEQNGAYTFLIDGQEATIERGDVDVISEDIPGWLVANEGNLTVALDITVTEELRREGIARELVKRIQNIRKQSGFEIIDKINILFNEDETVARVLESCGEYIAAQTLALSIKQEALAEGITISLEEFDIIAQIEKA